MTRFCLYSSPQKGHLEIEVRRVFLRHYDKVGSPGFMRDTSYCYGEFQPTSYPRMISETGFLEKLILAALLCDC